MNDVGSHLAIRAHLDRLATEAVGWEGPLPEGDLAEHLDSLQRLALVVAIEDHFHITFEPDDEQTVRTVDDVVRLVERKRHAAA